MKKLLEAGLIVNVHGIRGEVKIEPWSNSPDFLLGFKNFYIDGASFQIISAKVYKNHVIAKLSGVDDIGTADALRSKVVMIDAALYKLPPGKFFFKDLIGLEAVDAQTGNSLGVVTEIMDLPAGDVYVIAGDTEHLVPSAPEFIEEIDLARGIIRVKLIEGM